MAPSRFRVDQAVTVVLFKGTTPVLSLSPVYLRWTHFKEGTSEEGVFQPLTSNQMLPLPEVRDLGGVVVVDGVHASVLQPVRRGHPSSLHLHGVHFGGLAQFQHHQARHHLPSGEGCIVGSIQLQGERPDRTQGHRCERQHTHTDTFSNRLVARIVSQIQWLAYISPVCSKVYFTQWVSAQYRQYIRV